MRIEHLHKSFGEKHVLRDFSCEIPAGSVTAVTGPSGCGKTTLGHILLGIEKKDSGLLSGFDSITKAAVFQENRLIPRMTAVENLLLVLPRSYPRSDAEAALDRLGLFDDRNERVQAFSGGMKRRVAIARAILCRADFLVLDEPFKGLDDAMRLTAIDYVREHTMGATVLLITHTLDDAKRLGAEHILRLTFPETATI